MTAITSNLAGLCANLFTQAGIAAPPVRISPLRGGANNRVFRLEAETEESFLLKTYLANPQDDRDRLGTEWNFSSFLWNRGERCIAEPLACDPQARASLYRYIHGKAITVASVGPGQLEKAGEFIQRINDWRFPSREANLGSASEACFSLGEHLACVEQRIRRLENVAVDTSIQREAKLFVEQHLAPAWQRLCQKVLSRPHVVPAGVEVPLSREERCLSPSDFGFHNALEDGEGKIYWLDFEYAGWDDPAKLVCDFFCQPLVPVDIGHWKFFLSACGWPEEEKERIEMRARLLFPVFRIKWCCILMNEFLPSGAARRGFARGGSCGADVRAAQLAKARLALQACVAGEIEDGIH